VHHADSRAAGLDHELTWERLAQRRLVHVPVDGPDRPEPSELLEHGGRDDVAGVQDQIGGLETAQALVRDAPRPARQMRIRDNRDDCQRTMNGSLITVVDR
jgi:hypothetical protein